MDYSNTMKNAPKSCAGGEGGKRRGFGENASGIADMTRKYYEVNADSRL
jgi:hypothetical protein